MTYNLETFREQISYHPYLFWQIRGENSPSIPTDCNAIVFQEEWHRSAFSRSTVERALKSALNKFKNHLGYRVVPEYVEKEIAFPRPSNQTRHYLSNYDASGRFFNIDLQEGYVRKLGKLACLQVSSPTVAYSDLDSDSIAETATFSFNIAETISLDEISFYVPNSARNDGSTGAVEKWKIPHSLENLARTGVQVKVTLPIWILVNYSNYHVMSPVEIGTATLSSVRLSSVDVYREYIDETGQTLDDCQVVLKWRNHPGIYCSDSSDPAGGYESIGRAKIVDARSGIIQVGEAVYNSTTETWSSVDWSKKTQPDSVLVRYQAGSGVTEKDHAFPHSGDWLDALTMLTIAELHGHNCPCFGYNRMLDEYYVDLARIEGNAQNLYRISDVDLSNPIGTRRGHLLAWNQIKKLKMTKVQLF